MSGLDTLNPTDTHGIPIINYLLSLDHGLWGMPNGADLADWELTGIKVIGFIVLAMLNVVVLFNWLTPLVTLIEKVSDTITETLGVIGVFSMATTVGVMVIVTHWFKRTTHRIWYHLGLGFLLIIIAVAMVSPVRVAAQAVGLGGTVATEVGQRATGSDQSATISQILATKFIREPILRANFGTNLDDIVVTPAGPNTPAVTCGNLWDSALTEVWEGKRDKDTVKDVVKQCPGGTQLHAYAMDPNNLNFELQVGIGTTVIFALFVVIMMVRVVRGGFATVFHSGSFKPLTAAVMAGPTAQVLALRNALAIPLGFLDVGGNLLILVIGAAFTGFIALATGSGPIASVVTALMMIGLALGTMQYSQNLRGSSRNLAEQLARSGTPASPAASRQHLTTIAHRAGALATTLSNPVAAATSGLASGVFNGPRSTALLHQPGHQARGYANLPSAAPESIGSGQGQRSPIETAARTADQLYERSQPRALPSAPATSAGAAARTLLDSPQATSRAATAALPQSMYGSAPAERAARAADGGTHQTAPDAGQRMVPNPHYVTPGVLHGPLTESQQAIRDRSHEIVARLGLNPNPQASTDRASRAADGDQGRQS
ncbi:hypothetical protein [Mycobacteroides abscessus]|uniref:hypothetical protein n=1 Tax=Mycobacteroides abscessus TaxID=36809 RepID=UPI0021047AB3|nr:hypothetical protein [Mycobacteroides abscessus]